MSDRSEIVRAVILSILIAILTLLPYLVAQQITRPGDVFSGFLLNPIDGFSYLAKMRQGEQGGWLFELPYAAEPGAGSFLFVFYLFLGHLSRVTNISAIILFHLVRVIAGATLFITVFFFLKMFLVERVLRWMAYGLILVGSGLGWIAIPFNILASDLAIPESIPFLSAYANPHFPIAATLFLLLIMMTLSSKSISLTRIGAAIFFSTLLALIQPFVILTLGVILSGWVLWEAVFRSQATSGNERKRISGGVLSTALGLGIGAMPVLVYDVVLTLRHPAIAAWNAQNLTPSPPPVHYLLGFGSVFLLAVFAVAKRKTLPTKEDRLLIIWVLLQALLLYAPLGLQRRLSLGLFFPLAVLAIRGLHGIFSGRRIRLAFMVVLALSIPSNLIVVGSGLVGVQAEDGALVLSEDEQKAYGWFYNYAAPDALVLAGPVSGNRIPAYAKLRVMYGHPFETPDADVQLALLEQLFSTQESGSQGLKSLAALKIDYVLYGPREREIGQPLWIDELKLVSENGEYFIYENISP